MYNNNSNVATGNNNNNEGSKKIETMSKTNEIKKDKKEPNSTNKNCQ